MRNVNLIFVSVTRMVPSVYVQQASSALREYHNTPFEYTYLLFDEFQISFTTENLQSFRANDIAAAEIWKNGYFCMSRKS